MGIDELIIQAVKLGVQAAFQESERITVIVEPRCYSGAQAQKLLGVSSTHLYAALKTGALRGIKRGKRDWSISSVSMFELPAFIWFHAPR